MLLFGLCSSDPRSCFPLVLGPNGDNMYPFYLIIKKQQPCCLMPFCLLFSSCLLPNLLLNLSCASKIDTHVPTGIYSQACLKVIVKSITDLFDNCWSPSCKKLCFSTLFSNYDSCSIDYNPQLCNSLGSFIFSLFSFSFSDFLCNYLVLRMFRYSIDVANPL